jgi:hypothetical protein
VGWAFEVEAQGVVDDGGDGVGGAFEMGARQVMPGTGHDVVVSP